MLTAVQLHIKGIVQGVGFRPFVYREAKKNLINGWVLNATDGVHVVAEGEEQNVDAFVMAMSENAPAASDVKEIDIKEIPLEHFETFEIRHSDEEEDATRTLVSPDIATCDDCMRELFDPQDRRFHYPFINCTNCGPRYTIIDDLPYDRPKTSMGKFPMCPTCAHEYADPEDRRFHAQPDACFECGPHLSFLKLGTIDSSPSAQNDVNQVRHSEERSDEESDSVTWGMTLEESDAIIEECAAMLREGKILAVKGLGGFHLVCDALSEEACAELRNRKKRNNKAFAVMAKNIEVARKYCEINEAEEEILTGSVKPIVLLKRKDISPAPEVCSRGTGADSLRADPFDKLRAALSERTAALPQSLCGDLPELGVMLPYTPVQALLLNAFEGDLLVMTSGNLSDEPIVIKDDEAAEKFKGIADAILGNDREILTRFDDSVVRVLDFGNGETALQMVRRARGYAPRPIAIPIAAEAALRDDSLRSLRSSKGVSKGAANPSGTASRIFATGPEQKNTFCYAIGNNAFVSQHIGDVEDADVYDAWHEAKARMEKLFAVDDNCAIACDKHPEYLTSKWAFDHVAKAKDNISLTEVQHHHAHIVSAMAENNIDEAVFGFSFDGTGYGADGTIWGGEFLLANLETYERMANIAYFPLPGGAAAIKDPMRIAYGLLYAYDLLDEAPWVRDFEGASVCAQMIEAGINTPYTSSMGRLFDAVSALIGVCTKPTYEGEAAIELEAAITPRTEVCSKCAGDSLGPRDVALDVAEECATGTFLSAATASKPQRAMDYAFQIQKNSATEFSTALDTSVFVIDCEDLLRGIIADVKAGVSVAEIARAFHDAVVKLVVLLAQLGNQMYGINKCVLAGGVWMNRYLVEGAVRALSGAGFDVILNRELPPNDGGVSYGQVVNKRAIDRAKLSTGGGPSTGLGTAAEDEGDSE